MNLKKLVLLLVVALAGSTLFAFERGDCFEIREEGKEIVVKGTLDSRDGMTILKDGAKEYELLRGPGMFSYTDGTEVEIEGLVYEMKILPTKVKIDGVEFNVGPSRGRGCYRDGRWGFDRDRTNDKSGRGPGKGR